METRARNCILGVIAVGLCLWLSWFLLRGNPGRARDIDTSYLFSRAAIEAESGTLARSITPSTAAQRSNEEAGISQMVLQRQLARSLFRRGWVDGPISRLTAEERDAVRRGFADGDQLPEQTRLRLVRQRDGMLQLQIEGQGIYIGFTP